MNEQKQIRKMSVRDRLMNIICNDEIVDYLIKNNLVIPENAVVLTEDNAEEIGNMVVESPQMQEVMTDLIKAWKKETAEKIMNDLSNDVLVITTIDYGSIEVVPLDRISEICNNIIDGE